MKITRRQITNIVRRALYESADTGAGPFSQETVQKLTSLTTKPVIRGRQAETIKANLAGFLDAVAADKTQEALELYERLLENLETASGSSYGASSAIPKEVRDWVAAQA